MNGWELVVGWVIAALLALLHFDHYWKEYGEEVIANSDLAFLPAAVNELSFRISCCLVFLAWPLYALSWLWCAAGDWRQERKPDD